MPGQIQVIPPGLLGFFNIKRDGINPSQLLDQISPSLEMFRWYMQAGAEFLDTQTVSIAGGTTGFQEFTSGGGIVVPESEWWWIENFTVGAVLAAGDTAIFSLGWTINAGTPKTFQEDVMGNIGANSGPGVLTVRSARQFFLPPGAELGFFAHNVISGATIDFSGFARITRLPS